MATLLSTTVNGTVNSTGNMTAAGFTGNANVGGTGSATWHPSGIYSGSTQWLYGTTYRNGSGTYGQGNLYFDNNYGYGMVGLYSSTRYQAVFAMGDSYKLPADGTGTGTLYGIAWTHTNVGGESKSGLGHQALFMMNGRTYTAIGSGIWTDGTITTTSHGTSANWNTAYGWGNHASAGYQAASTAITTSNIGSQSVNYASSAGSANSVAWGNVSGRPTNVSSFSNDSGYVTSGGTINSAYRAVIEDTRGGQRTPNDYDDYRVSWEFTNQMPHDSNWLSTMTLQGWHDGYTAWQIQGPATSAAYETWYLRSGINGSWNTARTIIHSGNIGSQSVNYASSAGSVAWGNVSSRPTALSQFSNDLGNYGGWITSSGSISGNAATATRTSGQGGYPHPGTGMYAFYNWGGSNGGASAPSDSSYTIGIAVGSHPSDQAYGFQIGRNMWNTGLWTRGYDSGFGSWVRLLDSSNYTEYTMAKNSWNGNLYFNNDGRIYCTIMYDANDSGYYVDMNDTSRMYRINANYLYAYGWVYSEGDVIAYYSDERLKTKISNIQDPLEKIKQLNGFYYVNNETAAKYGYREQNVQIGLSAQEVQSILPEVVTLAPFDTDFDSAGNKVSKSGENYLTVNYDKIVPLLVESIKAQQEQIEELKAEVKKLRGE